MNSWGFEAIGTQWSIETAKPLGVLQQTIAERIEIFDKTYSRFRDDSLVSKISQSAGEYHFPTDVIKIIDFYYSLYSVTNGVMTPLVGAALVDAGYDRDYSLQPKKVIQNIPPWDQAMQWSESVLQTNMPVMLDVGAAGKGYLIDIVSEILEKAGHDIYVIDASGDIRVRGVRQNIGLEHPHDPSSVVGVAVVDNVSLCASAINRRSWGEWHHVINAKTAKPVRDIVATWAVASNAMIADGLATALFFVDADKLSNWNFEYVRLDKHGYIEKSSGFVGELFA